MKKIIAVALVLIMVFSLVACGTENTDIPDTNDTTNTDSTDATVGSTLAAAFKETSGTAQEIADALIQNEVIQFMGTTMPVEAGLLSGFGNTEIKGFKEGVMFAPMIGTIPFIGYIFVVEDGTDVEGFKTTLKDSADLRWNICTEAEELVVENVDNTVFFVMCPKNFETETPEGDDAGGMDIAPEDSIPAEDGITLE